MALQDYYSGNFLLSLVWAKFYISPKLHRVEESTRRSYILKKWLELMELWLDRPEVLKRLMWGRVTFFRSCLGALEKETALGIHVPDAAECTPASCGIHV